METTAFKQENMFTYERIEEIAAFLKARIETVPKVGIICGTGMGMLQSHIHGLYLYALSHQGAVADAVTDRISFPYKNIPHFPVSTVHGHAGRLVFGMLGGVPVVCMQGRFHIYEGYPLWVCSMPVRVMKLLGATHLIATNAAGGLNDNYKVGDIMIMKDHVNMVGFSGNNPLQGSNDERFGPRFPAVSRAYDSKLRAYARTAAKLAGAESFLQEGVYAILGGPNYETIAELKLLKALGVDAVGMSTVHEVITAVHCGMTAFAFSLITNECILDYDCEAEANHEEVVEVAQSREPVIKEFVTLMVQHMSKQ